MKKRFIKKTAIVVFWILLWQIAALLVHNPVYFASPLETLKELAVQGASAVFMRSLAGSLLRIVGGFAAAALAAFITAFISLRFSFFEELLKPPVSFLKSVPVAAVVVILLIWWGADHLVLCISFMVVFPNIYENMLMGLKKTDQGLLEMADVFGMGTAERFLWIYRSSYRPYLIPAMSVSLGMAFKSGVAAEIIGLPKNSIGEQLYRDKIYLNTAGVFAWIVTIILISFITEKLLMFIIKKISLIPAPCPAHVKSEKPAESRAAALVAEKLIKCYDDRKILDTPVRLEEGGVYCLSAPSGSGKTTLLHILAGILEPDSGSIEKRNVSMVFQEDRLISCANARRNLQLAGCRGDIEEVLAEVFPKEVLAQPAETLSGGEKRRTEILRALMHPSEILIMDEPFAGLDEASKKKMTELISLMRDGRTLLISSHDEEDADILKARRLVLKDGRLEEKA
ncbi:MAG: ATP-binding cassette domain-containing protein [Lachnospiraceae bacterium]|nr:ATP-binding cassette domain-containing protein [Lachnospiraceae bacterium]